MGQAAHHRFAFDEYLELEKLASSKHEFFDGQVWAMAGGSPMHAALAANVAALLLGQLRGKPCQVYGSDLRVRVASTGLATYPDVTIVCDRLESDPADDSGNTVLNPKVLIEILSPSTEAYDRGEKLAQYQSIPGLEEVVLVAQDRHHITVWRRGPSAFERTEYDSGSAELRSVGCVLLLEEVYRNPLGA